MKRIAIALMALALSLTACQSVSENIAENIVEQVAEQADGVGDVDFDVESGEISVETEDGSVTIGGGEIPDGFPIPVPDGYVVTSVFTSDGDASVSLAYGDGSYTDIEAFYDDWTEGQSAEWSKSSSSISTEEGTLDNANWSDNEGGSFISISSLCLVLDDSIDPENCVGVNLNASG